MFFNGEGFGVGEAVVGMALFIFVYKKIMKKRKPLPRQWESQKGDWGMDVDADEKEEGATKKKKK
jgi:hypothetical protein